MGGVPFDRATYYKFEQEIDQEARPVLAQRVAIAERLGRLG